MAQAASWPDAQLPPREPFHISSDGGCEHPPSPRQGAAVCSPGCCRVFTMGGFTLSPPMPPAPPAPPTLPTPPTRRATHHHPRHPGQARGQSGRPEVRGLGSGADLSRAASSARYRERTARRRSAASRVPHSARARTTSRICARKMGEAELSTSAPLIACEQGRGTS